MDRSTRGTLGVDGAAPLADLNALVVFARVVQAGSFTAAARVLRMPKSTVSRRVSELESLLGARLLERTTRQLRLTDAGRAFYERCERILAELTEAEQAISQLQNAPRGRLRVTTPLDFRFLGPWLAELLQRYPELSLELVSTDRLVDLVQEGFDLAIRAGALGDSGLISRRLTQWEALLVASPGYLEEHGEPSGPEGLEAHALLVFDGGSAGRSWRLTSDGHEVVVRLEGRLTSNNLPAVHDGARLGLGIALLPSFICAEDLRAGVLRRVLPGWATAPVPVHAVFPSNRNLVPKVRVLIDLLREKMEDPVARRDGNMAG